MQWLGLSMDCCGWCKFVLWVLGLIFGFMQWVFVGYRVGFDSISGGGLARGGLLGGSQWVCGVARDGAFHFWSIPMVLGVGIFMFLFYVAPNIQCEIFARALS